MKEWADNREDYTADMREFQFILELTLKHGILIETTSPGPIKPHAIKSMMDNLYSPAPVPVEVSVKYSFSQTGTAFMRACRPPSQRRASQA